jgi:hypothetical protein
MGNRMVNRRYMGNKKYVCNKGYAGTRKKNGGKWSLKYKNSIDCNHPKGFSQKQHCKYGRTKTHKKRKH